MQNASYPLAFPTVTRGCIQTAIVPKSHDLPQPRKMADTMPWIHDVLNSAPGDIPGQTLPWHLGVFDAHCHPTDTPSCQGKIPQMKARALIIMATRGEDQDRVVQFAESCGVTQISIPRLMKPDSHCQIIPSLGWHPWFSHQICDDSILGSEGTITQSNKLIHYRSIISPPPEDHEFVRSLPDPRPLSRLLDQIRGYLRQHPYALVGEIGLDRSFRLPENWLPNNHTERHPDMTPGGREGRRLSPFKVRIEHQKKILKAQLNLAGEMQRAVSVHGVAAHGVLFETIRDTWKGFEREVLSRKARKQRESAIKAHAGDEEDEGRVLQSGPSTSLLYPPRICLHSYSGPPDTLRQYFQPSVPAEIFCSFSVLVNLKPSTAAKTIEVIKAVPDDKILVESDLHCAGEHMDELLERMVKCVCTAKGWSLEKGVKQLASNWLRFTFRRKSEELHKIL